MKENEKVKILDHKKEQERKKQATQGEYEERLAKVLSLKKMTDTKAWRYLYDYIIAERKRHEIQILSEDKTRAMVAHQEAIKFMNALLNEAQAPIDRLNSYCAAMPLFNSEFHTRAQWNRANGSVDLVESR